MALVTLPGYTKQRAGVFSFQQQVPPGMKSPQHCASPECSGWLRSYSRHLGASNQNACIFIQLFVFQNLARSRRDIPVIIGHKSSILHPFFSA